MNALNQEETGKTSTALVLQAPADNPMYSAPVQQNNIRQMANFIAIQAHLEMTGVF